MKSDFQYTQGLANWNEGLRRSFNVLLGFERELLVNLAGLSKKYLIRCQNSSSKLFLRVFIKSEFQYSQVPVQLN